MVSTVHLCNQWEEGIKSLGERSVLVYVWLTPILWWYFSAADPAGATGISDGLAEQSAQGCSAD